jgi:hypothetical protein
MNSAAKFISNAFVWPLANSVSIHKVLSAQNLRADKSIRVTIARAIHPIAR